MEFDPTNPRPGIYRGLDPTLYYPLDRCCNSRLKSLARSPMHMRHEADNPPTVPTTIGVRDTLAFGQLLHALVLEDADEANRYVVTPDFRTEKGGTAHKEKAAWLASVAEEGRVIVEADAWEAARAMKAAVYGHVKARALLHSAADREVTAVFDDRWCGEPCKLRADAVSEQYRCCIDLKTTEDASPEAFGRSIGRYGYHRQAAFYLNGLARVGVSLDHFVLIAVEKQPPHGVAVYPVAHEAIEQGEREIVPLVRSYQACRASGRWPGYQGGGAEDVKQIDLPAWHYAAAAERGAA